jgi:iron(III) transport system permease protein
MREETAIRNRYNLPILIGLFGFIAAYLLYPQLDLILFSLRTETAFPTLRNFIEFFNPARTYSSALWHSLWLSATAVMTATGLGLPLAFLLTRFQFPGKTLFTTLATLPMIMPPFLGAYAFHLLLGKSGFLTRIIMQVCGLSTAPWSIDGAQGIILVQMINFFPYIFLSIRGALVNIDPSLEEAARDLGARKWRVLRTITLPMLLPGLTAGALLVFMNAMADFGTPYVMAPNYPVLATFILQQKVLGNYPLAMASAVILMNFSLLYFYLLPLWTCLPFVTQWPPKMSGKKRRRISY